MTRIQLCGIYHWNITQDIASINRGSPDDRQELPPSPYGDCCQEAEFSMSDRLKAHLIGRNEPVFETLFNQFHDPKMAALNITIDDGCPEHRQVLGSLGFLIES